MGTFIAVLLGMLKVLPDLLELFKDLRRKKPEQVSLKSKNVFKQLGDAKNEKERIQALRAIQRLVKRM